MEIIISVHDRLLAEENRIQSNTGSDNQYATWINQFVVSHLQKMSDPL